MRERGRVMAPYSNDVRERVLMAGDAGEGTREEVAGRFRVSARWVRKLLARRIATGSVAPKPDGGGREPSIRGRPRRRGPPSGTTPMPRSPGSAGRPASGVA